MTRIPSVLFVCVHNAGRSQMAAAYLTHLAGDRVEVRSAGSAPADSVNPAVVAALAEEGIDISAEVPKVLTVEAVQESDVVITMGCGDVCPVFPGKRYEDWVLEDPAGQGVEAVRPIRDEIRGRIEALIAEIAPHGSLTMTQAPTTEDPAEEAVLQRLSLLDRFLPVWILLAMAGGLLLGRLVPGVQGALDSVKVGETSLPIALGLLLMMYPVLAKVRYEEMGHVTGDRRLLWLSLLLNWVIGPFLMFVLAWVFLADEPAFRTGLIVIGLARCIAMVLIWNDLACGDGEAAALLVAINSLFQIVAYALLGTFYLAILPGWLGLDTQDVQFSTWDITKAVLFFLGIPLAAGYLTRRIGLRTKGKAWYEGTFLPAHRAVRAVRPALHHRRDVRPPGRRDPERPRLGGADRHPPARLLRGDVERLLLPRECARVSATRRRPRSPSPRLGTTSNWPSRSASACGA